MVTPPVLRASNEPNIRVAASGPTLYGLDISHHNGHVNWADVSARYPFAFIKATEGLHTVDPIFKLNWVEALSNKVYRGAYHFFHSNKDAIDQADLFLRTMGDLDAYSLPPVLDIEIHYGMDLKAEVNSALVWLQKVKRGCGKTPIIYLSPSFMNDLGNPEEFYEYPLWIANYGPHLAPSVPPPWHTWAFWQYTETGKAIGVKGNVDVNYFNGTLDDLKSL